MCVPIFYRGAFLRLVGVALQGIKPYFNGKSLCQKDFSEKDLLKVFCDTPDYGVGTCKSLTKIVLRK